MPAPSVAVLVAAALVGGAAVGVGLERAGVLSPLDEPEPAAVRSDVVDVFDCPEGTPLTALTRGDRIVATGRSDDGAWIEIRSPLGLDQRAWLAAATVAADGGAGVLEDLPEHECELARPTTTSTTSTSTTTTTTVPESTTTTEPPPETTQVTRPPATTTTAPVPPPQIRDTETDPFQVPVCGTTEVRVVTNPEAQQVRITQRFAVPGDQPVELTVVRVDATTWEAVSTTSPYPSPAEARFEVRASAGAHPDAVAQAVAFFAECEAPG